MLGIAGTGRSVAGCEQHHGCAEAEAAFPSRSFLNDNNSTWRLVLVPRLSEHWEGSHDVQKGPSRLVHFPQCYNPLLIISSVSSSHPEGFAKTNPLFFVPNKIKLIASNEELKRLSQQTA
jgi:hypothetical protein